MVLLLAGCNASHATDASPPPRGRSAESALSARPSPRPPKPEFGLEAPASEPGLALPTPDATQEPAVEAAADWQLTRSGGIEGYATRVSVLPGERFYLRVSTAAPYFTATAFRMGGQVRRVWTSGRVRGLLQPRPRTISTTKRMASAAHWKNSLIVSTSGWPEGAYLIRLDSPLGQRYVPVTVRSRSTRGKVVILNAVTTWQAYNAWGGRSLYRGPGGYKDRSWAVTFDRPYDGTGARKFLLFEKDVIETAERSGVPLAYLTDLDLVPGALDGARALVSLGHDEYWSPQMRQVVEQARDRGTNLAFLGANAVYWRIGLRGRVIECDKKVRCRRWRDVGKPESSLVGQMYACYPAEGTYLVTQPRHWVFRGTTGTSFPGLAGHEVDTVMRGSPKNVQILAESPVRCNEKSAVAHTTYYVAPSGAGVFATGTLRWVCAMRGSLCGHGVTDEAADFTRQVTTNVLRRFSEGPVRDSRADA